MVGVVQGLIGSYKGTVASPVYKKCSSVQIANLCCDAAYCGDMGAGVTCSTPSGTYDITC